MASSPSTRLRLELQAAGENLNTWGAPKLNAAVSRLEEALCGFVSTALSGALSLTSANYSGDQAHYQVLNLTSGTGGTITVPGVEKTYIVRNNTSGNVIVTTGSGATATIIAGDLSWVAIDATNCYKLQASDFAGSRLTNIGTPTAATDAVTKAYADALAMATFSGSIPAQGGNAGKFLQTNGTVPAWQFAVPVWTAVSSNIALAAGVLYEVDSSAARALTLPASPGAGGNSIRVADSKGLAGTNAITLTPSGSETMNAVGSDPLVLDVNWADVTLVPVAGGWRTVLQ